MTELDIVDRLRGKVRVPVNDGAGPLNGLDYFERTFPTSKAAMEAADEIERLRAEVAALRAQAGKDEPVAWFHPLHGGGIQVTSNSDVAQMWRENGANVQPLYAQSPPKNDDAKDAARYRRLRILGCAPGETAQLKAGTVMRFTNLDAHVDADIEANPSRGEFSREESHG